MRNIDSQSQAALASYLERAAELVKAGMVRSPSDLGNIASGILAVARSMESNETEDDPDWQFVEGECLSCINAELLTHMVRDNADWWEGLFAKMSFLPEEIRG